MLFGTKGRRVGVGMVPAVRSMGRRYSESVLATQMRELLVPGVVTAMLFELMGLPLPEGDPLG